jgi:hypothetical protein
MEHVDEFLKALNREKDCAQKLATLNQGIEDRINQAPGTGYEKLMDPNTIDMVQKSIELRETLRTLGDEARRLTSNPGRDFGRS